MVADKVQLHMTGENNIKLPDSVWVRTDHFFTSAINSILLDFQS